MFTQTVQQVVYALLLLSCANAPGGVSTPGAPQGAP